ncbi:hypothetical protein L218DRAFT_958838 [Marasmius fiardii PR-910]|nr:hypothetical protein L218DRAFT_958838 [Marasmius fiardii PR-910]
MPSTHSQTFRCTPLKHARLKPSYRNLWLKARPSSGDVAAENWYAVSFIVDYISTGELPCTYIDLSPF